MHADVWQRPPPQYKAIILQLKNVSINPKVSKHLECQEFYQEKYVGLWLCGIGNHILLNLYFFNSKIKDRWCWNHRVRSHSWIESKEKMKLYKSMYTGFSSVQFSSVQSLSRVQLFATPWIAACQASLSITNSRNSLRLTSIESVMPSSRLILCRPLLLLPPIPPSIRVFSNETALPMRWPKYWSFSFSIIPSKEIPGLILQIVKVLTSIFKL